MRESALKSMRIVVLLTQIIFNAIISENNLISVGS